MGHLSSTTKDLNIDLESGCSTSEEDGSKDPVSSHRQTKRSLYSFLGGILNSNHFVDSEHAINSSCVSGSSGAFGDQRVELLIEEIPDVGESQRHDSLREKFLNEKYKKGRIKRPPKPPRPPKGPSLNAADQLLVREITMLATRKRERIERSRALKKVKASQRSSSNGKILTMIVTLLFCLVIILEGLGSLGSKSAQHEGFNGAPELAMGTKESLISLRYLKMPSDSESIIPSTSFPHLS